MSVVVSSAPTSALDDSLSLRFVEAIGAHAELAPSARRLDAVLSIRIGHSTMLLEINRGIASIKSAHPAMNQTDLQISAPAEVWEEFWEHIPSPGSHDIFALRKSGRMTIEGNFLLFMTHLQVFKDLLALPRGN